MMDDPTLLIPRDLSQQDNDDHSPPPSTGSKHFTKFSAYKVDVNRKFRAAANVVNTSKQRMRASFSSRAAQSSSSSSSTVTTMNATNKLRQLNPKHHLQKWMQPSETKRKRTLNKRLHSELAVVQEQNHDLIQQVRMEKMDFSYQRNELEQQRLELETRLELNVNDDAQQRRRHDKLEPNRTMRARIRNVTPPTPGSNDHLPFEAAPEAPIGFLNESTTEPFPETTINNLAAAADRAPAKEEATTTKTEPSADAAASNSVAARSNAPAKEEANTTKTEPSAEAAASNSVAARSSASDKEEATTTTIATHVDDCNEVTEMQQIEVVDSNSVAACSSGSAKEMATATTNKNHQGDGEEVPEQYQQHPTGFSNESTMQTSAEVATGKTVAASSSAPDMEEVTTTINADQNDDSEEAPEHKIQQSQSSLTDPRLQILTYFNTVSAEEIVTTSLAVSPSVAEDMSTLQSKPPLVTKFQDKLSSSESTSSSSVFTVWRPTSAEAIRKMVEGEGVGKGLEIKGKSSKAGALSGFVPYLQINKEEHKSKVRTIDRGGRTRIFFVTEQARDAALADLGPLQNNILNAVQDAKRTVRHSVIQVLYVPHHAKKKVKQVGKVAKKTAKKTGKVAKKTAAMAGNTVSHATSTVSTSVVTAGSAVRIGATKGLSQAGGSVAKLSSRGFDSVSSAGGAIANFTSPVSTTVAKVTNPVGKNVANFTTPVRSGVKKGVTVAAGTVTNSFFKAAKGVSSARVSVSDSVTSSVSKAGKVAKKTGKVAKKTVAQATSTVSATVADPVANSVVNVGSTITRRASMVGSQASSTAKTAATTAVRGIGIAGEEDDEVEFALKRLLWDMDDPSIRKIDDYSPRCYGIELPDRLLWEAFVVDSDISRPEDSRWFTGRPSQPAFQDMNLIAISKSRKNQKKTKKKKKKKGVPPDPLVVLWQTCTGDGVDDNPMDPRGLVMAYEECGRVCPVVSDFDCFTMGTRQIRYDVLPEEQINLLEWCVSNIEVVLDRQNSSKHATWTDRWLDVLKSSAKKGFHPEIPKYGFGDAKSYEIVENAVDFLQDSGAVRHGAECFNFYFPQDLDDEFLIVSESLPDEPKWRYVGVEELLDFLFERVKEGYTFPLNPKWVLCDDERWKKLFDYLLASDAPNVQESLEAWMPHSVRDKIEAVRARHPNGFVSDKAKDDEVCGTEAMDLAMLDLDRLIILRRARNKLWMMGVFLTLLRDVRERRAEQESDNNEDDEEEGLQGSVGEGESLNGGDESDELSESKIA